MGNNARNSDDRMPHHRHNMTRGKSDGSAGPSWLKNNDGEKTGLIKG